MESSKEDFELTILMPCLNEAETLATCIKKAQTFLVEHNVFGEVLVADNGSTDGSQKIAGDCNARVIDVPERGYGAALINGLDAAKGKYVIMGDADDSYDFTNLMPFLVRLRLGDDLVMGNRFKGGIAKGAMPIHHRYLGNPILSGLGRLFFKCPIRDFHCGLRGYNAERMRALDLQTTGMEYASEMVVQATINDYKISEVPTTLSPDGRSRAPHLRSWRDGWRHLKFLLLHSPNWLFLYPGIVLMIFGLLIGIFIEVSKSSVLGLNFDINTLLYSAAMIIVGFNLIFFHEFTKTYAMKARFIKVNNQKSKGLNAEKCIFYGLLMIIVGIALTVWAFSLWGRESFGDLVPETFMRITIPAVTMIIIGIQLIFSSFLIEVLRIETKKFKGDE